MEPTTSPKRQPNKDYPERISHYEDADGKRLLEELAKRRGGMSLTAFLRQLTREEGRRIGLLDGEKAGTAK